MLFYGEVRCWNFLKTVSLCLLLFLSDKKVWSSKWQCVQLSGITGELQIPIFGKNLEDCYPPPAIVLNDTLLTLTHWQGNDLRGMAPVLNERGVKTHYMSVWTLYRSNLCIIFVTFSILYRFSTLPFPFRWNSSHFSSLHPECSTAWRMNLWSVQVFSVIILSHRFDSWVVFIMLFPFPVRLRC